MTKRLKVFYQNVPHDIDAVIITSPYNRRYYLSFNSSAGTLVVTRDKSYFIIDGRYFEAASESVKDCDIVLQEKLYNQVYEILNKHSVKTLGVEAEHTSLSEFLRLKERLSDIYISEDARISKIIAKQRSVKDSDEIEAMQKAQDITDKTFAHILGFIKPGKTELEISIEMEEYSRRLGSQRPAFEFIVAAGENSSRPHAVPSGRKVKDGDLIVLDFGSVYGDYCSDMTRTVGVGNISDKKREVYGIVLKAQLAALDLVKPGARCIDVDLAARGIIDESAYKGLLSHGVGHSIGLQCHEIPSFNKISEDVLEEGTAMSVEPGIYIPGEFGVRIEDVVAACAKGYRNLTHSPKELIIL